MFCNMRWTNPHKNTILWKTVGRESSLIDAICRRYNFSSTYIICMGILGTIFGVIDAVNITQHGDTLPPFMMRKRLKGNLVSVKKERDLKLMSTVFTATCHFFLVIGAYKEYTLLIYPWFLTQTIMIFGEVLVFFINLNLCQTSCITREGVFIGCFSLFNWKQVFCLLREILLGCCIC